MKAFLSHAEFKRIIELMEESGVSDKEVSKSGVQIAAGLEVDGIGPISIVSEEKIFFPSFNETYFDVKQPAIVMPKPGLIVPK